MSINNKGCLTSKIAMSNNPYLFNLKPVKLEFPDNTLEQEYWEDNYRYQRLIAQFLIVVNMTVLGLFFFAIPQDKVIYKLIYIATPILFTLGAGYILERRQRIAFPKQKEKELARAYILKVMTNLQPLY